MKINKKRLLIFFLPLVMIIAGGIYVWNIYRGDELLKVEVRPFKTNSGWGYDITVDNKTYIHQTTIPALAGNLAFSSKEDAVKTGNLVVKKLIAGRFPSLSAEEIKGLGVSPLPSGKQD